MTKIIRLGYLDYAEGHCGNIKNANLNNIDISVTYLKANKAREHYHKNTTELYYVAKGKGKIKLDDKIHDISEGDLIEISPLTRHKAFSENGLEILVIASPALSPSDNYFVDEE